MRVKKKNVEFAIIAKSKNKNKFTMEDLKEMEENRLTISFSVLVSKLKLVGIFIYFF